MIKIAFFDIDGTLVSFKTHRVPESAADAIRRLRENGVKVFIATGRHRKTIDNLGDLEFDGFVTMNGAYCFSGDNVIFKRAIPNSDIDAMISYQKEVHKFPVFFLGEDQIYANFFNEDAYELMDLINFPTPPIEPLESIRGKEIFQMVSFVDEPHEASLMAELPNCLSTRWYRSFTDIVNINTSKRAGVTRVLEYYGYNKEEAMAFGDGGNDIPMLQYVGCAVAMGNASDDVKKYASYIANSVDDDGILEALCHFRLI